MPATDARATGLLHTWVRTALLAAAVSGCLSPAEPTTPASGEFPFVGAWLLTGVNGAPLPYVIQESATYKVELTANRITFYSTGGFVETGSLRFTTVEGVVNQTSPEAGRWYSFTKGVVSYHSTISIGSAIGSVLRDTLTVTTATLPVRIMVYVRG